METLFDVNKKALQTVFSRQAGRSTRMSTSDLLKTFEKLGIVPVAAT